MVMSSMSGNVRQVFFCIFAGLYSETILYSPSFWSSFIVVVVVFRYLTIVLEKTSGGGGLGNLQGIRTFRVFRVLRTISIVPGESAQTFWIFIQVKISVLISYNLRDDILFSYSIQWALLKWGESYRAILYIHALKMPTYIMLAKLTKSDLTNTPKPKKEHTYSFFFES